MTTNLIVRHLILLLAMVLISCGSQRQEAPIEIAVVTPCEVISGGEIPLGLEGNIPDGAQVKWEAERGTFSRADDYPTTFIAPTTDKDIAVMVTAKVTFEEKVTSLTHVCTVKAEPKPTDTSVVAQTATSTVTPSPIPTDTPTGTPTANPTAMLTATLPPTTKTGLLTPLSCSQARIVTLARDASGQVDTTAGIYWNPHECDMVLQIYLDEKKIPIREYPNARSGAKNLEGIDSGDLEIKIWVPGSGVPADSVCIKGFPSGPTTRPATKGSSCVF